MASVAPRQIRLATVNVQSVPVTTTLVETPDGRELCVESGGDPTGTVVLNLDGWPGGRSLPGELLDGAAREGVHLLGYDRPGYGRSSPHPGRTVASCAEDVRTIALAFGIDRLGVCGASGGGPHALAVGALLPDLVTGVAVICSLAPRDASGLDFLAGMQDDIAQIHRWFDDDLGAVRRWATSYRTEVEGYSAEQIEQMAAEGFPDDAPSQTFFRSYTESVRSALEPGTEGIVDDGVAFHSSWGFEVGTIGTQVRLWSGPADLHVPLAHSRWLTAQLPGAPLDASGSGGHLEIIARALPVAHRWLAGQR